MLYLLRHAQTTGNRDDLIYGAMDCPLTEEGVRTSVRLGQSVRCANYLGRIGSPNRFDRVYVSKHSRTVQTYNHAELQSTGRVIVEPALNELHKGEWEGVVSKGNEAYIRALLGNPDWKFPGEGSESINDMWARLWPFMQKVALEAIDDEVLVVSSGGPLRHFLGEVCFGDYCSTRNVPMPNCGYYRLMADAEGRLGRLHHFDVDASDWRAGQYQKDIDGQDKSGAWHVA